MPLNFTAIDFEPVVEGMHEDKAEPIAGSARSMGVDVEGVEV